MSAVPEEAGVDTLPAGIDKTVVKSLGMLERLVDLGRPMGVTELALATRLQKSNVHRILSTLRHLGYVRSNADSSYEPTLRVWELGQRIHAFAPTPVGTHLKASVGGAEGRVVLVIRGELLQRYPDAMILALRAGSLDARGHPTFIDPDADSSAMARVLFHAHLDPDITLVGFDLSAARQFKSLSRDRLTPCGAVAHPHLSGTWRD